MTPILYFTSQRISQYTVEFLTPVKRLILIVNNRFVIKKCPKERMKTEVASIQSPKVRSF